MILPLPTITATTVVPGSPSNRADELSTTERLESCPNCGLARVGGARYCSQCGHEVADYDSEGASAADRDLAELRDRLVEALGSTLELGGLVGRGGFGYVFSAWDSALERRVAVKSLRADLAVWPGFLERFRREAQVLASLSHDNIVEVFRFGESQGVAYMVTWHIR